MRAKYLLFTLVMFFLKVSVAQHWYPASPVGNNIDINSVAILNRGCVFLAGGHENDIQSIFKSADYGLTWDSVMSVPNPWLTSIAFVDTLNGFGVGYTGTLLKSVNAGLYFTSVSSPVNVDFNKVVYANISTLFAVGGNKLNDDSSQTILKSIDGGNNWNIVLKQPGKWLKSVYFIDSLNGIAIGDSGTILKTSNSGGLWAPVSSPVQRDLNGIIFIDALNGFIVGGKQFNDSIRTILKTTDGGNSWNVVIDEPGAWLTDLTFSNQNNGYIVGDKATLFISYDAGQNWTIQPINGSTGNEYLTSIKFFDTNFGIIGAKGGKVFTYLNQQLPDVLILGAHYIDSANYKVDAIIITNGTPAQYSLDLSTDSNFTSPSSTVIQNINTDYFAQVNIFATGLNPSTKYYYRLVLKSILGTQYIDTLNFYTYNYIITTDSIKNITFTTAQVYGSVKHITLDETPRIVFWVKNNMAGYAIDTTIPSLIIDTLKHVLVGNLTGLMADTLYYFTFEISTPFGNITGDTLSFHTNAAIFYNALKTLPPNNITDTSAQFTGFVNHVVLPSTVYFGYGTDLNFSNTITGPLFNDTIGTNIINDTLSHTFSSFAHPLQSGQLCYVRAEVKVANRFYYGDTLVFFVGKYTAKTLPASNITLTSAQLNGGVDNLFSNNDTIRFEYGTTTALGTVVDASPFIITDTFQHAVSATVNGLQTNTFYYYRLSGNTDSLGAFWGEIKTFYTGYNEIPNWDFQQWRQDTFHLLNLWNIWGDDYTRVPGHSGNYALRIAGSTIVMSGMQNDAYQYNNRDGFIGGLPFHARPDSLSVYMNYNFITGDSGTVGLYLYSGNTVMAHTFYLITGNSGGVFKKLTFPVNYISGLTPDSVILVFVAANANDYSPVFHATDFMTIDDVMFSPGSPPIYNGDIETWFDYPHNSLLGWSYQNHYCVDESNINSPPFVAQTIFNTPNDYAAEIHTLYYRNEWWGGDLSNRQGLITDYGNGFTVNARHQVLNGYYKAFPVAGDTMGILIEMYKAGQMIGQGGGSMTDTVSDFTLFEIPIQYFDSTSIPDTALIRISTHSAIAHGPSRLVVDKLSFDGFSVIVNPLDVAPIAADGDGIKVYPNPAKNNLIIEMHEAVGANSFIQLFSIDGRLAKEVKAEQGNSRAEIDVSDMNGGFYILRLISNERMYSKKIIIQK